VIRTDISFSGFGAPIYPFDSFRWRKPSVTAISEVW
jgi:hypothetical protein